MQKSKLYLGLALVAALMVTSTSFAAPVNPPPSVPDSGSSALMLSAGFAGMAMLRNFFGKKR